MDIQCLRLFFRFVLLLCCPKPVAADSDAGTTAGIILAIIFFIIVPCICKYCYRKHCTDTDSGYSGAVVVRRPEPEITVIVSHERIEHVQTPQGAGLVHTRAVADSDGNIATRQSVYAIS